MRAFQRFGLLFVVGLWFFMPVAASAGEPTAQLSKTINEFMTILTKTSVAELQTTGLPESARKLVYARFDFSEMTKRALGSHWTALQPGEQKEFVEAFTQRLLTLFGRTVRSTGNDKIQFNREVQDGQTAIVETKVISDNVDETPIDFRLHNVSGQWKVHDVVIEDVSLVSNYRAQFERVIAKSSIKELLKKMKNPKQNS